MDIINEPDSPALTAFLHKVEPTISKLLIKNMRSTAFEGLFVCILYSAFTQFLTEVSGIKINSVFAVGFSTAQELDSGQVVCNHTLTNTDSNSSVTGLSWNATGSVVAASYPFTTMVMLDVLGPTPSDLCDSCGMLSCRGGEWGLM